MYFLFQKVGNVSALPSARNICCSIAGNILEASVESERKKVADCRCVSSARCVVENAVSLHVSACCVVFYDCIQYGSTLWIRSIFQSACTRTVAWCCGG